MMLLDSLNVTLEVRYCTGLRKVDSRDFENSAERRRIATEQLARCQVELRRSCGNLEENNDRWQRDVEVRYRDVLKARARLAEVPEKPTRPNTFVAVVLGRNDDSDTVHKIGHTKVVKQSCSPIWHHKMGRIALGRKIRCCTLDDAEIKASRLVFQVWHDDGRTIDDVPALDGGDAEWHRETPRKSALLAYAYWDLKDIVQHVSCGPIYEDLKLIDARNGIAVGDQSLTIYFEVDMDLPQTPKSRWSRFGTMLKNCTSFVRVSRRT